MQAIRWLPPILASLLVSMKFVPGCLAGEMPPAVPAAAELPKGAIATLGSHRLRIVGQAESLEFSADGKLLACGTAGSPSLYVWNVQTGALVRQLSTELQKVLHVWFTDGDSVLNGLGVGADGQYRWQRWGANDWLPLSDGELGARHGSQFTGYLRSRGQVRGFRLNPRQNTVTFFDVLRGEDVLTIEHGGRPEILLSDDQRIAVVYFDSLRNRGSIEVWDLQTLEKILAITGIDRSPKSWAISPDRKILIANGVRWWDLETGKFIGEFWGGAAQDRFLFTPDGKRLLCLGRTEVNLYDVGSRRLIHSIRLPLALKSTLALSPNGALAAFTGSDGTMHLWDLNTGKLRFHNAKPGYISHMVLSADGKKAVTGLNVTTWDIASRALQQVMPFKSHRVRLSPDGTRIAAVQEAGLTLVGPADDPDRLVSLPQRVNAEFVLAASRDAQILAIGETSGLIQIRPFKPEPGKPPVRSLSMPGHVGEIVALAFSGDNSVLTSRGVDGTLRVWSTASGELTNAFKLESGPGTTLGVSEDGARVAASVENRVAVWDTARAQMLARFEAPVEVTHLTFAPEGSGLITVDVGGQILLWDIAQGKHQARQRIRDRSGISGLACSPDGKLVAVVVASDVYLLDGKTLEHRAKLDSVRLVGKICFDVKSEKIAFGGRSQQVQVWDVNTKERLNHHTRIGESRALAFTRDADYVVLLDATGLQRSIHLPYDKRFGRGTGVFTSTTGDVDGDCAFAPDGKTLARSTPTAVCLWDLASGQNVDNLACPENWENAVAFSPRDHRLAAGGNGIGIWDLNTKQLGIRIPANQSGVISHLTFSPEGLVLAARHESGEVDFWQASSGRRMASIGECLGEVSFSADGRVIVALANLRRGFPVVEKSLTFWDVPTGQKLFERTDLPAKTFSCRLSDDGVTLATGDHDGRLTLWDFPALMQTEFAVTPELAETSTARLWEDLHSESAATTYRAAWALAARPREALAKAADEIPMTRPPSDADIETWIEELGSTDLSKRRTASAELRRAGQSAFPHLRRALDGGLAEDVRARIDLLLVAEANTPEEGAQLRTLQLLERIGSPDAMVLVKTVRDSGTPWLQLHAASVLRRLGHDDPSTR